MEIKRILEYDYNYAEYIVTDGQFDIVCMCMSVPLENNIEPKIGMKVERLYAFSYDETIKLKISNFKRCFIQKDLKNIYPNGFDTTIKNGDYVEFEVDRIDCTLI